MKALINEIELNLKLELNSIYIIAVDCDGDKLKIRTSNHTANAHNNNGERCISFITKKNPAKYLNGQMDEEFLVEYDEEFELFLDSERNSIEEILSDYCLKGFYLKGEFVKF